MKPWIRILFVLLATASATTALPVVDAFAGAPRCLGTRATIVGTARADVIHGTSRADVIVTLGGPTRSMREA